MADKAKKAKKAKKTNKNLIIGICVAVIVIVVVIVVAVVLGKNQGINDSYFVSDDTKYVLTIDSADMETDDDNYAPVKTHIVYTYSGDEITGLKSYYEYPDADAAKAAFDYMKSEAVEEDLGQIEVDGKYIVVTAPADQYEGMTASDVKQQVEFMQLLQSGNYDETDGTEDAEDVETDTTEVVDEAD